jgi:MFS family permease
LLVARLVYAYNWYNIGAVLPLLAVDLSVGTAQLGIVLGVFLVGVGIFQIPAGFASIRWGPRRVAILGLGVMGVAGIASAFSPDLFILAISRFVAGVGAALFFAPALALISRYFPPGERGPVIGLYNGAFSIGGAIGLFGGAAAGALEGWRFALGVGGVLLVLAGACMAWIIPPDSGLYKPSTLTELWRRGAGVLRSRSIWALAFALTGFWGAVYVVAQYLVQYAYEGHPGWGTSVAAALAAGVVFAAFPGGPVGGWLGERSADRRKVVALFSVLTGAMFFLIPVGPLVIVGVALILLGFFNGLVFSIQYLMPSYFTDTRDEGIALGIGFLNSVQVLVGSGIAIGFGYLTGPFGWTAAWIFAGAITLALLPLLLLVERQTAEREDGPYRPTAVSRPRLR